MKKKYLLMATFALSAAMLTTSCHKDDDDDNTEISGKEYASKTSIFTATILNKEFSGTATLSTSNTYKVLFGDKTSALLQAKNGSNTLSIYTSSNYSGTYISSLRQIADTTKNNLNTLVQNLLNGEELTETQSKKLSAVTIYPALVTYSIDNAEVGNNGFYYSTAAAVNIAVKNSNYVTGSFYAKLRNSDGDTCSISNGVFNIPLDND